MASIYRKIKKTISDRINLVLGIPSLWGGVHWGRLVDRIGVPALLIGKRGETSLVAGTGPNGRRRCQIQ